MTEQPAPATYQPGDDLVDDLIQFWHTRSHGKLLDEAAADWLNRHLPASPATRHIEGQACHEETFVGIEPIEDDDGEPTSATMVMASCSGNIADNCGWRKRLTQHDHAPADWWLTSDQMDTLHSEHMTHTPAADRVVDPSAEGGA